MTRKSDQTLFDDIDELLFANSIEVFFEGDDCDDSFMEDEVWGDVPFIPEPLFDKNGGRRSRKFAKRGSKSPRRRRRRGTGA